jgi:hypothetical protein
MQTHGRDTGLDRRSGHRGAVGCADAEGARSDM